MKPALLAYLGLSRLMAPVWRWGLGHRLKKGKETEASVHQKLGLAYAQRPAGPLIWGHAVGVGEANALAGLFARLTEEHPGLHCLITTTARTSGDALARTGLPPRCQHQFAPVDTPDAVRRFLGHWQPDLAVWCEMDLWPALIAETDRRHIPRVLVNARLSAESLAKRRWGRWLYRALLPGFRELFAQNVESAEGLVSLGAPRPQITVTGTIKSLVPPLGHDAAALQAWQAALGQRPVWLLASSHPGEEALALAAHERLRQQCPDALLIIAPRAPARGAEVAALAGPATPLRSAGAALPGAGPVYVADTIGEMGLWYRLAPVALVGGSFARVGGHNPHEPLALGCGVLHGPNVWNFAESYDRLDAQGFTHPVNEVGGIVTGVLSAWQRAERLEAPPPEPQAQVVLQRLRSLLPTWPA